MTTIVEELVAVLGYEIEGEANLKKFNKSIDNMAQNVGRVAGYIGGVMSAAFVGIGKSTTSTSAEFEGFKVQLETIEGSSEKAQKSLDWISEFAKKTPFEVAGITDSFVKLKAYGIDPLADDALRVLGDTASAMNKPLESSVEAFADAATFQFERLRTFGLTTQTVGDEVTFSWDKNGKTLSKTVKKSSEEIRKFLLDNLGGRYNGAMEKQSNTWNGIMSNMADMWTMFQKRIGDAGFFDNIKEKLKRLLNIINRLDQDGTLDRWAREISKSLSSTIDFVEKVINRIVHHYKYLSKEMEGGLPVLKLIGGAFALLVARAFPLITAFTLLALGIDDLLTYMQGGSSVIGDFISWIQRMTGVSENAAQVMGGLGLTIATAFGIGLISRPLGILKLFGRYLWMGLAALAPLVMKGVIAAFALVSNPVGWAVILAGIAGGLIWYFWDELKLAWASLKPMMLKLMGDLGDWIKSFSLFGVGVQIIKSLWNGMKSIGSKIKEWFQEMLPIGIESINGPALGANLERMNGYGGLAQNTIGGSTTRSQNIQNTFNIEQNVAQASDAPNKLAEASGNALSKVMPDRAQLH